MKTKLTELLNIEYPIICGGMMWVGKKELAAAVSNAGGLGIMTALSFPSPEALREEIHALRKLTDKPFGINLTFLPTLKPIPYEDYLKVLVEEKIKIIETAGRSPEPYMPTFKKYGMKVIHKCTSLKHALKAEKIGCDMVSIDGFECAGHPGESDVTSLILVPIVAAKLQIPVVASGGFADGRGLVAALSLGAEGVNMGTRFLLTQEAPLHQNLKDTLLKASEIDTVLVERSLKNSLRVLNNAHAKKILALEAKGAGLAELAPLLSGKKGQQAYQNGQGEEALLALGQCIGLIQSIPDVATLMDTMITDAKEVIAARLSPLL